MSQIDDFLDGKAATPAAPKVSAIDAFLGEDKPKEPGLARGAADSLIAFGSGVTSGVQSLANVAGADNPVSQGLGKATKFLTDMDSPERKAEKQNRAATIKKAEESGSTWEEVKAYGGAFAEAPLDTTLNALGSSVPTLAAAFLTGGTSVPAQVAARALPLAIGGAQGAGAVKGQIYEAVEQEHLKAGKTPEEAAALASKAQAYDGKNTGQIAAATGLGMVAGTSGAEAAARRFVGGKVAKDAAMGIGKAAGLGVLKETPVEMLQGGQERVASNLALQNEGFDTPTWQGVAGQAALEGLASAPMGAGFGMLDARGGPTVNPNTAAEPPAQPPAPQPPNYDANALQALQQTRLDALASEEAGAPDVPQVPPPDGAAALAAQTERANRARQAMIDLSRATESPDDEILQSTGMGTPPMKPSVSMGIDPNAGVISKVAAEAVDGPASMEMAVRQAERDMAALAAEDNPEAGADAAPTFNDPLEAQVAGYVGEMGTASPQMVAAKFGVTIPRAAELLAQADPTVDDLFPPPQGAANVSNADAAGALAAGTGGAVGADAAGSGSDAGLLAPAAGSSAAGDTGAPGPAVQESDAAPVPGRDSDKALTKGPTQTKAKVGGLKELIARNKAAKANVQDQPQATAPAAAPAPAPAVQAPQTVGSDGAAQPGAAPAGRAGVEADGVGGKFPSGVVGKHSFGRKSIGLQNADDRRSADAKLFSDLVAGKTFSQERLDGLDAETQAAVQRHMLRIAQDPKVLDAVVKLIPVDVVNMLGGFKLTPQMVLNDPSVLKRNGVRGDGNDPVSIPIDGAASVMRAVARVTAENLAFDKLPHSGGLPVNGSAANDAGIPGAVDVVRGAANHSSGPVSSGAGFVAKDVGRTNDERFGPGNAGTALAAGNGDGQGIDSFKIREGIVSQTQQTEAQGREETALLSDSVKPVSKYQLPQGRVSDSWFDAKKRGTDHPDYEPTPRQQMLMDEVAKAKDAGAFYANDVKDAVAKALGVDAETRAANTTGVEGGDFGYDVHLAGRAVDAKRKNASEKEVAKELNLKAGDKLGTLVFNDMKVTNSVEVESVSDDGLSYNFKGKRGPVGVKFSTGPVSVKGAIERAHEKGKRKDSYEQFIAARKAPAAPAVAAPAPSQQAQAPAEPQEITHNGTRIYRTRTKLGDEVKAMWAVETPENKARRAAGERALGGDTLHDTIEQAKAAADREAKQYAERKAFAEEQDKAERARKEADEARKAGNRGKSIAERRKETVLDGQSKLPASAGLGNTTRRNAMQMAVDQGRAVVERQVDDTAAKKRDQDAIDRVRSAGYMLGLSNENIPVVKAGLEAQARLKANDYKKPEYRVYAGSEPTGGFFEITKIEYEYAQELMAKKAAEPAAPAAAPTPQADEFLPDGWTQSVNGYTKRPVYRMEQDGGKPFAVVTQTEGMTYEVQIRHGDKQLTISTQRGALSEVLAGAKAELAKMTQAASVTHQDPGEKPEAATKGVVNDSLKTAAKNEDTKPSEMRKWLLAEIDKELLQAPDRADYDEAVKRLGEKDAISMYTGNGFLGKNTETGFITFDVPGDGKFKVRNSVRGLLEFRKTVNSSLGFKDSGQKTLKPEQNDGVQGGSGGQMAAVTNMIEEGDFEAARDYAEAVGIKLEDVKVPRGDMKPAWEKYLKDGTVPPPPNTAPLPEKKTADQLNAEKLEAEEAERRRPKDTGWNMAGTGYGGKRYTGRNITLDDGRQVVARIYENAGRYNEVEIKVDGARKFTVTDEYSAQDKADAFIRTLTSTGGDAAAPAAEPKARPAARVTPQISGDPEKFIKVAADSVRELRSVDVDRVLTETPVQFRAEVAGYIKDRRQDLADEVNDVMADLQPRADAPTAKPAPSIPEGYNPAGEPFYRDGELIQGYAPFDLGQRVTMKESGGQSGVIDLFTSPDDGGVFSGAMVKFDNGVEQIVKLNKLEAEATPAATGTRRDPTKVSMFNPYNDGDIVTIDGQDWTVKADTPGWYLTTTGNWRGQHPTIRNVKAMADLIREVEQAAEAKPAAAQPETPKLTQAEAKDLMEWQDLGQKDGIKTHILTFYESKADKDAKRGRMTVATVSKEVDSKTWVLESNGEKYAMLGFAKKRAEEAGMAKAVADGFVEPAAAAPEAPKKGLAGARAKKAAEVEAQRAAYFTPGNIVKGYGGHDRVLEYTPVDERGTWSVRVQAVVKQGEQWVDAPRERPRWHSTQPETKELAAGPLVSAPGAAEPEQDAKAAPATSIADAGEKIGGARKDRWKERGLNLSDLDSMSESEGAELATKANVWKPDWEALAGQSDPVTAATVKVIYDRLAAQPEKNTPEGRRQFVEMMQAVRKVFGGIASAEQLKTAKNDLLFNELKWTEGRAGDDGRAAENAKGIDDLGAHMKAAKAKLFSVYKGRSDPFVLGFNELQRVKKMVADGFPAKAEPWKARLVVGRLQGGPGTTERGFELYIKDSAELGTPLTRDQIAAGFYRVLDKKNNVVAFAPTKEDAEAAAKTIYERDMKGGKDSKPEPERPYLDELKREGLPQRIDRDVTSDDFIKDLGFRGIEFGNWAAQDERQRILNMAYDGLMDLAQIMGVPPKAMSLNGTLGMAFGARGGGRFAAHYEPGKLVINMTKLRGSGSMAHEFAHALDHYFGELNKPDAYTTQARGASGWYTEDQYRGIPRKRMEQIEGKWKSVEKMRLDNLRPEMAKAFDDVMLALFQKQMNKAEMVRSSELELERTQAAALTEKDPELKAMYERMAQNQKQALEELRKDPEDAMYANRGRSEFANQAQALSGKATNGYWTRPTEMFARAFESWVFDRVAGMGARSDYLVHGVEEDRFAGGGYKGNPYPTGEERARINAAFDKLTQTIKTKEDDAGNVALFSQSLAPVAPGQGVTRQQAEEVVEKALDALGMRGVVTPQVVQNTLSAGLGATPPEVVPSGGNARGQVYLFLDGLADQAEAFRVVFHELFHLGLSQSVKPAEYTQTMLQFLRDPLVREYANRWKQSADGKNRLRTMPMNNWHALAVEEALADIAEEMNAERGGIGTKDMQGWVKRTIAWLADTAQKWGLPAVARRLRGMTYTQAEAFVQATMLKARTGAPTLLPDTRFAQTGRVGRGTTADMPVFNNASGDFNPDLDKYWIKQGRKEINGEGMSDADYNTAVAEYANQWRINDLLEQLGWRRRGSSNLSASTYYQKDIELDAPNEDGEDTLTYEVRVTDHDDYHPADATITKRFQIGFRADEARWSDAAITPDMSTADALSLLRGTLEIDPSAPVSGGVLMRSPRELAGMATDQLKMTLTAPGKLSWWSKTVGTMYGLAERHPAFKPVFNAAQSFIDDVSYYATDAADMAPKMLPKLENWRDIAKSPISAEDNKAIEAPVNEGTLLWARDESGRPVKVAELEAQAADMTTDQKARRLLRNDKISEGVLRMWQGLPQEQYEKLIESRYESQMLAPGVVWTDAELKAIWKLNDTQIGLYREVRAAIDKSLDNLAKSDLVRFVGKDGAGIKDAIMEADSVDAAALLARDYFIGLSEAEPDRAEMLLATANGVMDRADKVTRLKEQGYAPLSRFGKYTVDVVTEEGRQYFGLFESMREANQMAARMRGEFGKDAVSQGTLSDESFKLFQGITPETLELFGNMLGLSDTGDTPQDQAFQAYLKLTKNNRSAMKRLIQRKGILGYSQDVGRVLASFIYSNARQTAGALHIGDLTEAVNAIPQSQGELKDEAVRLAEYIQNPQEEAQAFRGLLFAQYLGGSIASAMVNMTQPLQVSFPYLSQFGGASVAGKELMRAIKGIATGKKDYEPDLARALKHAEEDGTVSPQEVHQLMAQARGAGTLRSGDGTKLGDALAKGGNAWAKMSLAWGKVFGVAEQMNRRSTFIAAYRLATAQKMDDPAGFAKKAVHETQFIYSKANKMRWGRGAIGGVAMTFKSYSVSYLELLHRMATQGGPEGKRAAMLAVAVLLVMGGAGGLPFMEDAEDIADAIAQVMGYNFSTKQAKQELLQDLFGEAAGQFIERGVSGLPGVPLDVTGRLGMGNLIPGTGLFLQKNSNTRDVLEIAGPAGDLAQRVMNAGGMAVRGNLGGAALELSPKALRDLAKGADMADKGMYRDAKGFKVLDTTPVEAGLKAIGFQPNTVAQVQEANYLMQRQKDYYNATAQNIRAKWARGLFEQDDAMVAEAREAINTWNEKNPDQRMSPNMPAIWRRVREMAKDKDQRIADTAPKAMRQQFREETARVREAL